MKKGQSSMEYLMVIAFALAIVFAGSMVFLVTLANSRAQAQVDEIDNMGRDIVEKSELLFYKGGYSKRVIDFVGRNRITDIYVDSANPKELVINVNTREGPSSLVFYSNVEIVDKLMDTTPGSPADREEMVKEITNVLLLKHVDTNETSGKKTHCVLMCNERGESASLPCEGCS